MCRYLVAFIIITHITLCGACGDSETLKGSVNSKMPNDAILEGSICVTIGWINETIPKMQQGSALEQINAVFGGPPCKVAFDKDVTGTAFWRFYIMGSGVDGHPQYEIYQGDFSNGMLTEGFLIPTGTAGSDPIY